MSGHGRVMSFEMVLAACIAFAVCKAMGFVAVEYLASGVQLVSSGTGRRPRRTLVCGGRLLTR